MRLYDYAGSANAYKIRLLLRQLGTPYECVPVDIFKGEGRTPEFLRKNPVGQVPVLELDDGRCIAESNAILVHIARGTRFFPKDAFDQTKVLQWLFFEQYNVEPTLGSARFWLLTGRAAARGEELGRRIDAGRAALQTMDRVLADQPFFVGNAYTIADIALYAYSHLAADAGVDLAALSVRACVVRAGRGPAWLPAGSRRLRRQRPRIVSGRGGGGSGRRRNGKEERESWERMRKE